MGQIFDKIMQKQAGRAGTQETANSEMWKTKIDFDKKKVAKTAEMDLFDRFMAKHAFEATKPVKSITAKPTAKPANAGVKPTGKPGAGVDPNAKIDPATGKPMFEGCKFQAGLKTEKDETKVMVSTTKPKADLGFKELASTFINKVNIGDAKGK